jgi:hypothetical protein
MPRPPVEVADVIRTAGEGFFECRPKWFSWLHLKVLHAILCCRTAALGGHTDACSRCGHEAVSFNSCRNRHCPKCQANARDRWLEARGKELLPTRYVHVVFTLPRQLAPLALQNKREIYGLLFRASAETLMEVARDPQRLGAEIGFFSVLPTWNQKLQAHPHVHCVVPAGGLAPHHLRWIDSQQKFFLPVDVLKEVFRGKFVDGLRTLHAEHKLGFHGTLAVLPNPKAFAAWLRPLFRSPWVVYAKRPFRGAPHALRYLGQYTHGVAISNHRLVSLADGRVTFRLARFRSPQQEASDDAARPRVLTKIPVARAAAWIRPHPLFGWMAHRRRGASLPLCLQLLAPSGRFLEAEPAEKPAGAPRPLWICPQCGGPMVLIKRLSPVELRWRSPPFLAGLRP